jgi:hypothetical protein
VRSRSTLRARSLYNDRINRNLSSWPVAGPSLFSRFVRVILVQGRLVMLVREMHIHYHFLFDMIF